MKKPLIVANWKSNKTESEAKEWIQGLKIEDEGLENKEVIVCPPFTLLATLTSFIINLPIKLGAQDISPFGEGAYTGEISAKQIKEFADYVIVGHSERRKNFGETDDLIAKKIEQAAAHGLTPILCISDLKQLAHYTLQAKRYPLIVAYEPLFAIGSGNPDTPESADKVAKEIKEKLGNVQILYGGSVKAENVGGFTAKEHINGVLVGGASLDAEEFGLIIKHAG